MKYIHIYALLTTTDFKSKEEDNQLLHEKREKTTNR